jgi:hypothetical protein
MVTVERKFAKEFMSVIAPLKLHRRFNGNRAVDHVYHFVLAENGSLRATNGEVQVTVSAPAVSGETAVIPYAAMKEAVADKTGADLHVGDDGVLRTAVAHPYLYAVPAPHEIPEIAIDGYEKKVLSLPAGELAEAGELACLAVNERDPAVFRFVLVRCREGKAVLVATNRQFLVEFELPGRTFHEGDILVPLAALSAFVRAVKAFKIERATFSVVLAGKDLYPKIVIFRDEGGHVSVKAKAGIGEYPEHTVVFPRDSTVSVKPSPELVKAVEAAGKKCRESGFSLLFRVQACTVGAVAELSLVNESNDQVIKFTALPVWAWGEGTALVKPKYLRDALKILAARNGWLGIYNTGKLNNLTGTGRGIRLVAFGRRIPGDLTRAA